MGLETARLLAAEKQRVLLVDRQPPAREASWAAAGILTTRGCRQPSSQSRELYVRSIQAYPKWLDQLSRESGLPIDLTRGGDYAFMLSAVAADEFQRQLDAERAAPCETLDEVPDHLAPLTLPAGGRLFFFPAESYVNNRQLLEALSAIVEKNPLIEKRYDLPHLSFDADHPRISLAVDGRHWTADRVAICSGVWSGSILSRLGWIAPLTPVKGEIYQLPRCLPGSAMIHIDDTHYLVPRGTTTLAGATSKLDCWDKDLTETGRCELEKVFRRIFPSFHIPPDAPGWSGIRPMTPDGVAYTGFIDPAHRWAINSGHYRSGISLAPLSCRLFVRGLVEGFMPEELKAFDPLRTGGLLR